MTPTGSRPCVSPPRLACPGLLRGRQTRPFLGKDWTYRLVHISCLISVYYPYKGISIDLTHIDWTDVIPLYPEDMAMRNHVTDVMGQARGRCVRKSKKMGRL